MRVIEARALSAEQIQRWREILAAEQRLASPYFCPEYTQLLAAVRPSTYVAIIEQNGREVGFFPFQKNLMGVGKPLGGPLSDYQAVIAEPGASWDPLELVSAAGLSVWDFDHLVGWQEAFEPHTSSETRSPGIDLVNGYEEYVQSTVASSSNYKGAMRRRRKLEREVGALRFEFHTEDSEVFAKVIDWKRQQCQASGAPDFFAQEWSQELMRLLVTVQEPGFAGVLSALYAGQELVAAHLGMRSASVLHWWFPVYNHKFSKYSPGVNLLLESARESADRGLTLLDFGKGEEPYKQQFMNHETPLREGSVMTTQRSRATRQLLDGLRHWHADAAWLKPLEVPGRALRRFDRWLCYR